MQSFTRYTVLILMSVFVLAASAFTQSLTRDLSFGRGGSVEVINRYGRVEIAADEKVADEIKLSAWSTSPLSLDDPDLKIDTSGKDARIEVMPKNGRKRLDITLRVPERTRLKVETLDGEVRLSGNIEAADVLTETGTIAGDFPLDDLRYRLHWTGSRPRYVADFDLTKVKEKAGGRFEIVGSYREEKENDSEEPAAESSRSEGEKPAADKKKDSKRVALNFTTERGIVLLNVPPNEVSSDLRERPLTNAAKAIVRSGDRVLTEAIRRASPKYFGDFARTLPPAMHEPALVARSVFSDNPVSTIKQATVRVTDVYNRAVSDLRPGDFEISENGVGREIIDVKPATAPFNLVLLLDVSGSVDNYVNFIRKAARSFVNTVDEKDRISIVLFNEDVKQLVNFTVDKKKLSESLDTFDAGGATSYYDAIAFTLADTLRPLRGERTAIVILTDGDDNRSFLPFDSLIGAVEESGALIYPLYVPSALIAASAGNPETDIDPLRRKYMSLSTKVEGEGEKLAKVSGGVYYPITQLSQIQQAYDDIVVQLRTAYSVTFRSTTADVAPDRASPRLKARVKKPNTFATIGAVISVGTVGNNK